MKEIYMEMIQREMEQMPLDEYLTLMHQQNIMETYEEERTRLQSDKQTDLGEITEDSKRESDRREENN